ncbi:MAG: hypothetical protein JEZ02_21895 [Desulfatibacillum sp.]|nr:hypothetical protein [Desulfatibacillum sp.]
MAKIKRWFWTRTHRLAGTILTTLPYCDTTSRLLDRLLVRAEMEAD